MSEKDVTAIEYFKDNEHFADLINTYYFHGEQVVQPTDIHEHERTDVLPPTPKQTKKSSVISRDIIRNITVLMNSTIIALEEQSDIHYAMPVRVLVGDGANYYSQWKTIQKAHVKSNDLRGDEFLSGFAKNDRLIPVSTLVLYFGHKPWDGPRCLKDMLNLETLPQNIEAAISDYPIQILEVRTFTDYEKFQTDLKWIFGFLQRDSDIQKLRLYIKEHETIFKNLPEETYNMISQFSHSRELNKQKNKYRTKEGRNC